MGNARPSQQRGKPFTFFWQTFSFQNRNRENLIPPAGYWVSSLLGAFPPSSPTAFAMSWIYGATGEMAFWNEQIKSEARVKQTWERTYGVSIPTEKAGADAKKASSEAKEAAHKLYITTATARPKLGKVPPTWRTKCGPTGMTRTWVPTSAKASADDDGM